MVGFFRQRNAVFALAIGSLITFSLNIWFNAVAKPETIEDYLWLARVQEPGTYVGEKIAWGLYSKIGYPWNVRVAVPCAYGILIVMWTAVVFTVLYLGRLAALVFKVVSKGRRLQ